MERIAGLVLAGGLSTRLGRDKASTPLAGRPLLRWVVDSLAAAGCEPIVVVHARGQDLPNLEASAVMLVEDLFEARGPLAGMASGFPAIDDELCFVAACDVPLLRPALVAALAELAEGYDAVVPMAGEHLQPLTAIYRPATCLPVFREAVEREALKVVATFGALNVHLAGEEEWREADPEMLSFHNANSAAALADLEALVAARGLSPGVG